MDRDRHREEVACYRTALVCRNGHVATDDLEGAPEKNQVFCRECGAEKSQSARTATSLFTVKHSQFDSLQDRQTLPAPTAGR